jgi:hypothetical protein
MPISQIGTNAIESGAVTAADLATGAVNLASSTVTGILPSANGGTGTSAGVTGFKNRIINGAMVISQRYGTSAQTPTNGQYVLDRFQYNLNQTGKFSAGQYTNAPAGFTNSMGISSNSAYSLGAGDYFTITQPIEGYNVADLNWGTANAKTVTLSAWVYSSLTGTFGGSLMNGAFNYSYPFTYTISAANTWTQISITVAGPTAGTWPTDNSASLQVNFGLGVGTTYSGTSGAWSASLKFSATGAVSVVSTSGATFYITGVQLEVGTAATNFDVRSYGTEFDLCRRYFEIYSGGTTVEGNIPQGIAQVDAANRPEIMLFYYPKRTGPTISTSGTFQCNTMANTGIACTFAGTYVGTYNYGSNLFFSVSSGVTPNTLSGVVMILFGTSGGGSISISAEL